MMKSYTWLLFDADNTLFDYNAAESHALKLSFDQMGYPFQPHYAAVYQKINHQMWAAFERGEVTQSILRSRRFALTLEELDLSGDPLAFSEVYLRNLGNGMHLIDGAESILAALAEHYQFLLITNGLQDVQYSRLVQSTIGHYFPNPVISDEVGVAKPHAAIFDICFARMNQPAKDKVLIIGDSLTSDMLGGYRYGIDTCWFNLQGKACHLDIELTYEIEKLYQLLDILL